MKWLKNYRFEDHIQRNGDAVVERGVVGQHGGQVEQRQDEVILGGNLRPLTEAPKTEGQRAEAKQPNTGDEEVLHKGDKVGGLGGDSGGGRNKGKKNLSLLSTLCYQQTKHPLSTDRKTASMKAMFRQQASRLATIS